MRKIGEIRKTAFATRAITDIFSADVPMLGMTA